MGAKAGEITSKEAIIHVRLTKTPGQDAAGLVPGVDLHHQFSFPSGHTTTAFAILVLAGLISGKRWITFLLILLAWMVGLSRVYLSQHFLMDILAGSFIGLLSALLFYWYFQRINRQWLEKSIIRFR